MVVDKVDLFLSPLFYSLPHTLLQLILLVARRYDGMERQVPAEWRYEKILRVGDNVLTNVRQVAE